MKALWQRISWHARQMLAEDPRVVVLSLLTLALGLGVHAGLLNSMIRSRLAHRSRTATSSMVIADRAFAGASAIVTMPRAVPSSDADIAAFVRKLAAKHNRPVECVRTRRRSTRRVRSMKSVWIIDLPALPAEPAQPADATDSTASPAAATGAPAAKTFVVITRPNTAPDPAPDVTPEPPASPTNVERSAPAGTSPGTGGPHSKPKCPDSK